MSDVSDDEIGGAYETPYKAPVKKPASKAIKPSSRAGAVPGAVAGPSSKPASSTAGAKRKAAHRSPEVSGSDGEVEEVLAQPAKKKTTEPAANANIKATTAKGKGKAKADPPSKVVESVEQDSEAIEEFEALEPKPAARAANGAAKAKKAPVPAATAAVAAAAAVVRTEKSFEKEMARLRQRCEEAETRAAILTSQLEELHHVRHTAAEESLDHQSTHYEARIDTQEKLIQELTSQLARAEPLARAGKSSLLHFLSRDAADEEHRALEDEVARLKDIAKAKDAFIGERDRHVREMEQTERELRFELAAEIERSKALVVKQPPGSATRGGGARPRGGGIFGTDEPKNAAVIQLYEDLTNLLVPNMRFETGKYLDLDDKCFTCVYTYVDQTGNDQGAMEQSLTFTLRFYHDIPIPQDERTPADERVTDISQLTEHIKYSPLELDKEAPDFVEKLRFLGETFTFGREQLALFLKTMYDTLGGAGQPEGDPEEEEEEEMEYEE
ncbi:hypothetical protein FIBSPDRAFT_953935 [Athelia psychrophila]|uniref:Monopolin complex subunit Csm1/Pcs1 C-terminal domain-containing protein n=1 Tax=Athelia psychrophila TaxID=1759441 RepID=A0A166JTP3_9AGAM|nr:hypothetical protein FIBSPDRAFT_953935 [Fibularhizoctonia sp. CBS 109695]